MGILKKHQVGTGAPDLCRKHEGHCLARGAASLSRGGGRCNILPTGDAGLTAWRVEPLKGLRSETIATDAELLKRRTPRTRSRRVGRIGEGADAAVPRTAPAGRMRYVATLKMSFDYIVSECNLALWGAGRVYDDQLR